MYVLVLEQDACHLQDYRKSAWNAVHTGKKLVLGRTNCVFDSDAPQTATCIYSTITGRTIAWDLILRKIIIPV